MPGCISGAAGGFLQPRPCDQERKHDMHKMARPTAGPLPLVVECGQRVRGDGSALCCQKQREPLPCTDSLCVKGTVPSSGQVGLLPGRSPVFTACSSFLWRLELFSCPISLERGAYQVGFPLRNLGPHPAFFSFNRVDLWVIRKEVALVSERVY